MTWTDTKTSVRLLATTIPGYVCAETLVGETEMNEELSPRRLVTLEEPEGRVEMEVYLELEIGEQTYALLTPLDLPINAVEDMGEGELQGITDEELPELLIHIRDSLKPWGLKAELDGDELYIVGDAPDDFFEECDFIEVNSEGEETEFAVIIEIETGDRNFLILTPTMPDLYPAEILEADRARSLTDSELTDLEETFRLALRQFDEEEEDD